MALLKWEGNVGAVACGVAIQEAVVVIGCWAAILLLATVLATAGVRTAGVGVPLFATGLVAALKKLPYVVGVATVGCGVPRPDVVCEGYWLGVNQL